MKERWKECLEGLQEVLGRSFSLPPLSCQSTTIHLPPGGKKGVTERVEIINIILLRADVENGQKSDPEQTPRYQGGFVVVLFWGG